MEPSVFTGHTNTAEAGGSTVGVGRRQREETGCSGSKENYYKVRYSWYYLESVLNLVMCRSSDHYHDGQPNHFTVKFDDIDPKRRRKCLKTVAYTNYHIRNFNLGFRILM